MNKSEILLELKNVKKMLKIADIRLGKVYPAEQGSLVELAEGRSWASSAGHKIDRIISSLEQEVGSISEK